MCGRLNRVSKKGFTEKATFLQKTKPRRYLGKSIPDRGDSRCKGPEVGAMPGMLEEWQNDTAATGAKQTENQRECSQMERKQHPDLSPELRLR